MCANFEQTVYDGIFTAQDGESNIANFYYIKDNNGIKQVSEAVSVEVK